MTFKGIPTFRILSYNQVIDFYCNFLGFEIDWEHRFREDDPVYMQISRDGFRLHLSENNRFQTGAVTFVETKGIKDFHRELTENDATEPVPEITITPWNTLQLEIEDPFGNVLRFNQEKVT